MSSSASRLPSRSGSLSDGGAEGFSAEGSFGTSGCGTDTDASAGSPAGMSTLPGTDSASVDGTGAGIGSEGTGSEDTGSEGTGSEGTGSEGTGSEDTGLEGIGSDGISSDDIGSEGTGSEGAGSEGAGSGTAGSDATGSTEVAEVGS